MDDAPIIETHPAGDSDQLISPGAVETPMLREIEKLVASEAIEAVTRPIGRRSSAVEQAWPLIFLNSAAASYINGADLAVDGGFSARMNASSGTSAAQTQDESQ